MTKRCLIATIGTAALAYVLTTAVVHATLPWEPHIHGYTEKMEFFRQRKDGFNVIFLGSSRVYRNIDPRSFDEATAESAMITRSYNLGVDALTLIELRAQVRTILSMRPAELQYVLIEPAFGTNLPLRNIATRRSVYFRDLDSVWLEIRANALAPRARVTIGRNALAGLYHYANLGRLSDVVFRRPATTSRFLTPEEQMTSLGFLAQETDPTPATAKWHELLMNNLDRYEPLMKAEKIYPREVTADSVAMIESLLEMTDEIRRAEIQPVFVITPAWHGTGRLLDFVSAHRDRAQPPPLMSYLDDFEEIYDVAFWHDPGHLSEDGARLFSRRLGQDFAHTFRVEMID